MKKLFIIADGASSGNGRSAGIGVVIKDEKGVTLEALSEYVGKLTNNEAEYTAVERGMRIAKGMGATNIVIITDSELVVRQLNREWKVKTPGLREYIKDIERLRSGFLEVVFDYVPREYTHEADELARAASEKGEEKVVEEKYPFLTHQK